MANRRKKQDTSVLVARSYASHPTKGAGNPNYKAMPRRDIFDRINLQRSIDKIEKSIKASNASLAKAKSSVRRLVKEFKAGLENEYAANNNSSLNNPFSRYGVLSEINKARTRRKTTSEPIYNDANPNAFNYNKFNAPNGRRQSPIGARPPYDPELYSNNPFSPNYVGGPRNYRPDYVERPREYRPDYVERPREYRPEYIDHPGRAIPEYSKASMRDIPDYAKTTVRDTPEYSKNSIRDIPDYAKTSLRDVPEYNQPLGDMPEYIRTIRRDIPDYIESPGDFTADYIEGSREFRPEYIERSRSFIPEYDENASKYMSDYAGSSSKVDYIGSSSKVDYIGSSSKVDYIGSSSKVDYIGSSSKVDYIASSSKVDYPGSSRSFISEHPGSSMNKLDYSVRSNKVDPDYEVTFRQFRPDYVHNPIVYEEEDREKSSLKFEDLLTDAPRTEYHESTPSIDIEEPKINFRQVDEVMKRLYRRTNNFFFDTNHSPPPVRTRPFGDDESQTEEFAKRELCKLNPSEICRNLMHNLEILVTSAANSRLRAEEYIAKHQNQHQQQRNDQAQHLNQDQQKVQVQSKHGYIFNGNSKCVRLEEPRQDQHQKQQNQVQRKHRYVLNGESSCIRIEDMTMEERQKHRQKLRQQLQLREEQRESNKRKRPTRFFSSGVSQLDLQDLSLEGSPARQRSGQTLEDNLYDISTSSAKRALRKLDTSRKLVTSYNAYDEFMLADSEDYAFIETRFGRILYSPKIQDDKYMYRFIVLSNEAQNVVEMLSRCSKTGAGGTYNYKRLLSESQIMHDLGIRMSGGWTHYFYFKNGHKELILRKAI
ncbi:conserved hypothetical protein [Theileria orientalis strain Shintoku]|uniref:Cyclin-dependent kinases regulatory subunit n=1 Tax=Theileria orientalis strain Shintoku TaxID=869250 RepID=J4CDK8_THEOR|nr:conserved hypothetical protein [Theileria orientalis strain Shintoku]BAM41317.1 conserved hypothetical protein [Theileria orientalis strain Shintoku]|eukprot:XP_009691618.1 conserved hypothetical protein [Theileria orientalis strain Shintoku]